MTDIISRGPVTTQVLRRGDRVLLQTTLDGGEYGDGVSSLNLTREQARQMADDLLEAAL